MTTGKQIVSIAAAEIGVKESPPDSNRVKYNAWYYGRNVSGSAYPWCMAFVQWVYAQAGAALPCKTASCGSLLNWYRANAPERIVDKPVPGCVVIFDFPGGYDTDHTGIFESESGDYITTIDGNTGTTNEANGGAVMRRTRPKKNVRAYIVPEALAAEGESPREDKEMDEKRFNTMEEISTFEPWATETVAMLIERGYIRGNGNLVDGRGRPADMDLSRDMLRLLVMLDRAGAWG